MRRATEKERERASFELRAWAKSGSLGLGPVARGALERAAVRLGYANRSAASHHYRDPELYSEAIEDVESAE